MTPTFAAVVLGLAVAFAPACGQSPAKTEPAEAPQTVAPAPVAKAEHAFRGKVEAVNAADKTFSVNGENVEGWMAPMTMTYKASNPEIFASVKVGDQITAKVFDGDFSTLHEVAIVAATK